MWTTKKPAAIVAFLAIAVLVAFSFGQNKPAPKGAAARAPILYRGTITHVPSAVVREWQDFQKNEVIPTMRKIGITQRTVLTTALFGESGEFIMYSPIQGLTQFDDPNPIAKALGQEGAAALATKGQRFNTNSRSFLLVARPDLSINPQPGYAVKLAVLLRTSVTPERNGEYEKNFKTVLPVIAKTNAKGLLTGKVELGGNPNEYHIGALFDSFADLQAFMPAFTKAMAEAKLAPMPAGIVMHVETSIARYVPELSMRPAAAKAAK